MPLVLIAILGLGFWSYTTARQNSVNALYQFIETILDIHFVSDIQQKTKLLENSKMSKVNYFVKHYKQEILNDFKHDAELIEGSHVFIFSSKGELLFSSRGESKVSMEQAWSDIVREAVSAGHAKDYLKMPPYQCFFSAHYFLPWKWVVFLSMEDKKILQSISKIRQTTIIMATIFGLSTIFLLIFISRRFLIRPIQELQQTATQIAQQKKVAPLKVRTKDELGQLAHEMGVMAEAIGTYNDEQLKLQRDLKQSNISLQKSEERLRLSTEKAAVAVWEYDLSLNKMERSDNHDSLYGLEQQDVWIMDTFLNATHPEDRERSNNIIQNSIKPGGPDNYSFDFRVIWPDKSVHWLSVSGVISERDKNEVATMIRGCLIDITERFIAEKENQKLQVRLHQSQKMESIGQLAGGIAHDFNNILYPILGFTQMVMDDLPKTHKVQEDLKDILDGAKRARDLVKRILLFSRQKEQILKPIILKPVIEETLKLLRSSIPANINIQQKYYDGEDYVLSDPTEIHEIVMNLCTNAYHALKDKDGTIKVDLNKIAPDPDLNLPSGDYICLSVSDDGDGIPPTKIDKIFEPYFTTKEIGKGTGLGLSVVHGIVKNYKGDIHVTSSSNKGTVFSVFLPTTSQKDDDIQQPHKSVGGNERILFVDDEQSIVKLGVRILKSKGYNVTGTQAPEEAFSLFNSKPDDFDLVITDMAMPKMVGSKLAKKILDIRPDIPIIICSGYSDKLDTLEAKELNVKAFIDKPILVEELTAKVREVLDQI